MAKIKPLLYSALICTLALYIRIRYVMYAPFEFKTDAWSMYNYALNVVNGEYYGRCFGDIWARYAYWPPLYIFLSGLIYKYLGTAQDFLIMRLIQAGFSAISCLLVYGIAEESARRYSRYHRETGLVSGLLTALNPSMVAYSNHLYSETVFITIYLGLIYSGLKYVKHDLYKRISGSSGEKKQHYLTVFSVLLGIGNLTRPVLLLLPFAFLIYAGLQSYFCTGKRSLKKIIRIILTDLIYVAALMLLVMSPWIIRNAIVTGRFILVDTNGPVNFYIAHNPLANGGWVDVKPYTDINRLYESGYREGLNYIGKNVKNELRLLLVKQKLFLFEGDPHLIEAKTYLDKTFNLSLGKISLRLPQISFSFLLYSSYILLLLFIIKLYFKKTPYILACEPSWIVINLMYVNMIILIFYFAPRYRIIAEPLVCIISGILGAGIADTPDNLIDYKYTCKNP
jgi:hypothetical protein